MQWHKYSVKTLCFPHTAALSTPRALSSEILTLCFFFSLSLAIILPIGKASQFMILIPFSQVEIEFTIVAFTAVVPLYHDSL